MSAAKNELLRAMRVAAGKSQRKLARQCFLSHTYISKLEIGIVPVDILSTDASMRLREALGVPWDAWADIFPEKRWEFMIRSGHFGEVEARWSEFLASCEQRGQR